MVWLDDFMPLAEWALRHQDLRHQYLFSSTASEIVSTPGIAWTFEATVVLAIYEAALGKGYKEDETIGYEKAYPHSGKRQGNTNPKRADLAFKDSGQGKNWGYIEVKYYGANGKSWVQHEIKKLKSIKQRSQRWIFIYRVRPNSGRSQPLDKLLNKNFKDDLKLHPMSSVPTVDDAEWKLGVCEFCLAKVL